MIQRQWAIELAESVGLGGVIDGAENLIDPVFRGIVDVYETTDQAITGDPQTIDYVASILFSMAYIVAMAGAIYLALNSVSWVWRKTGRGQWGKRTKVLLSGVIWFVLAVVDSLVSGRIHVSNLTFENAERIYVVRQGLLGGVDQTVTLDTLVFGFLNNTQTEAWIMLFMALFVLAPLTYEYIPVITSSFQQMGALFGVTFVGYAVSQTTSVDPLSTIPFAVAFWIHLLFVWVVVGTLFAFIGSAVFRAIMDFFTGTHGYLSAPDRIKYLRDGTVWLLFLIPFAGTEYAFTLSFLAWMSYKKWEFDGIVRGDQREQEDWVEA